MKKESLKDFWNQVKNNPTSLRREERIMKKRTKKENQHTKLVKYPFKISIWQKFSPMASKRQYEIEEPRSHIVKPET